jgi:hypothetical protein
VIGIHYGIPEATYHADPCPAPSLSNSIGKLLVRRSPLHAWHAHPRLNPDHEAQDDNAAMDAGTILHKLLLGAGAEIEPILVRYGPKHERAGELVTDWKTKAAQEAADAAREAGKIPVLPHTLQSLCAASAAARRQLERHPEGKMLFEPGKPEATLVWREGAAWCRARVDWLLDDPRLPPLDLKTTKLSAAPEAWERRVQIEYAFQDAFYRRGLRALGHGGRQPMRFLVVEQEAPYGVSVLAPAPSLAILAEAEVDRAIRIWTQCIERNEWPGYPPFTAHVEAKPWQAQAAAERDLRDEIMENAQ